MEVLRRQRSSSALGEYYPLRRERIGVVILGQTGWAEVQSTSVEVIVVALAHSGLEDDDVVVLPQIDVLGNLDPHPY
jgi:hypothetical protein